MLLNHPSHAKTGLLAWGHPVLRVPTISEEEKEGSGGQGDVGNARRAGFALPLQTYLELIPL